MAALFSLSPTDLVFSACLNSEFSGRIFRWHPAHRLQGAYRSRRVTEFKFQTFQPDKPRNPAWVPESCGKLSDLVTVFLMRVYVLEFMHYQYSLLGS